MCSGRLPPTILFRSTPFRAVQGSGDAGHHGGREGGVPVLLDVLQRPLQRRESLLRGVGGLHPSGLSVCQPPGRKVRLGQERVPSAFCVWLGEKSSSLASSVLPSSDVQFTEDRHSRKSTVRGATNPRFTVDRLPKTSTIHEWQTSNTSTFHGRQTSNKPTAHAGQTSKATIHGRLKLCASPRRLPPCLLVCLRACLLAASARWSGLGFCARG